MLGMEEKTVNGTAPPPRRREEDADDVPDSVAAIDDMLVLWRTVQYSTLGLPFGTPLERCSGLQLFQQ